MGIYKIESNQLTICLGLGTERPRSFTAEPGSNSVLFCLRRQTEEDRLAVQQLLAASREKLASAEKLKRLGSALHEFSRTHRHLPPNILHTPLDAPEHPGTEPHSWRVALLPYLGHRDLYDQYFFSEPWDSPRNLALIAKMPEVFRHPTAESEVTDSAYFMFTGPGTFQDGTDKPTLGQVVDGTANTAILVETPREIPWTKPEDIAYHPDKPIPEIGSYYEGRLFLGLLTGEPLLLKGDVGEKVIRQLIEKADKAWLDVRSHKETLPRRDRVR